VSRNDFESEKENSFPNFPEEQKGREGKDNSDCTLIYASNTDW
jgi:hypothetical protein